MRMIKTIILTMLTLWQATPAIAQHEDVEYDKNWYFGYSAMSGFPGVGINAMYFGNNGVSIYEGPTSFFDCADTNISISDADGNLIFYSNGAYVFDVGNTLMQGGDTLSPSQYTTDKYDTGHFIAQGIMALPHPGNDNRWHLFHNYAAAGPPGYSVVAPEIFHSTIDMTLNNGFGAVDMANDVILDSLYFRTNGRTAVRHANGRDWWILFNEMNSDRYHRFILEPTGLRFIDVTTFGSPITHGLGQTIYSPDGSMLARLDSYDENEIAANIFEVDRCTGELFNQVTISDNPGFSGGAAFSPNSRYLYTTNGITVYQYDVWADDIAASGVMVAEYDGFTDPEWFVPTYFYAMQLAPDNKIYITTTNSSTYMHVIHAPDSAGMACNLEQHGVQFPFLQRSMPNNPYYKLGRLVGSPCDTVYTLTAIEEPAISEPVISLYPNPTRGEVQINVASPAYIGDRLVFELYDLSGKRLRSLSITSSYPTVDLSQLPAGVYIGRISAASGKVLHTEKIVSLQD